MFAVCHRFEGCQSGSALSRVLDCIFGVQPHRCKPTGRWTSGCDLPEEKTGRESLFVVEMRWDCWWLKSGKLTSWGKGSLFHYLQGFIYPWWCRISAMNRMDVSSFEDFCLTDFWFKKKHWGNDANLTAIVCSNGLRIDMPWPTETGNAIWGLNNTLIAKPSQDDWKDDPGTLNNHLWMDVWWNNHFLRKDLESSNWNNHF